MEEGGSSANGDIDPTTSPMATFLGFRRRGAGEDDEDAESSAAADEPKRGGTLLLGVANVGGSLTVLLQIALVAWGIRQLRSMLARRKERIEAAERARIGVLSPEALRVLVELRSVPHFLVDVREAAVASERPTPFESVLNIPETDLKETLQLSEPEWKNRFPSASKPVQSDYMVFLSTKDDEAQRAASVAADLGYSGCAVLAGGIDAYATTSSNHVDVPLKFLSRDAVAALMENPDKGGSRSVHLLDVRRPEELSSFGQIRGSKHIPVVELPKALKLDEVAWKKAYHFPKFSNDDIVIFQCRGKGRATWGAQLGLDAGLKHCYVYSDGTFGWRFDPAVLPYDSYDPGEATPDPINFDVEKPNYEAAEKELEQLGLT